MASYSWFSDNNHSSFSSWDSYVYTPGIPMVTGRADINGNHPLYISSVGAIWVSGGGTPFATVYYQGVETQGGFTWGNSGGTFEFRIHHTGTMYFAREQNNGYTTYDAGDGTAFAPGGMPGVLNYAIVSTPPGIAVSINGRNATVTVYAPADNGGAGITSYTVQYSKDGGAWTGNRGGGTTTYLDLAPGSYRFRTWAGNAAGSSQIAQSGSYLLASGGKIKDAGVMKPLTLKIKDANVMKPLTLKTKDAGVWKTLN